MQPSFLYLFYLQLFNPPPVPRVDLSGKTVVVVGASGGIGFEAAKHFATMNPGRLILACRDRGRGEAAVAKIVRETEYKNVELWLLDLTDFASVSAFAERYEKEGGRLDILVENAGIIPSKGQKMTRDGWEPTFQTNNLATSLLGLLLLPRMLETAEKYRTIPRLVVVTSGLHYFTKLEDHIVDSPNPFQVFGAENSFDPSSQRVLREGLGSSTFRQTIIINSVEPGYCESNLRGNLTGLEYAFGRLLDKIFAFTSEQGSRQLVWASVGRTPGENEISLHGEFISFMAVWESSDYVVSQRGGEVQEKLWYELIKELEKINPKVRQIVDQHLTQ